MPGAPRYALYYVPPPETPLYRLGASLLGYDAYAGLALPFPGGIEEELPDWRELTASPRPYGFHATLKAPFALAADRQEEDLRAACAAFAAAPRAVPVIEPAVELLDGFVALVMRQPSDALDSLAADCVRAFDAFRAPLTARDRARRNPAALTADQVALLDRWGYPYVMEAFRFHMTLTGRLPVARQAAVRATLQEWFATLDLGTLAIDRLALSRQDEAGAPFQVLAHWRLRDAA